MIRQFKSVIAVVLILLSLGVVAGCGRQDANPAVGSSPRTKLEAVKPNEDDGAIYGVTKDFINALVKDEREKVLSLMTAEHRGEWNDDSFLIPVDAKAKFDEIKLENMQYTVVKYLNNEETNFENTGIIFAVYDVVMAKNGQEAERVKIQESLAFRKENGTWLVSMDERGFLVEKN